MNENYLCDRFLDTEEELIDRYVQESYWSDDFSTYKLWEVLLRVARDRNITLTDVDTFDYDKALMNIYECTEKGLS